MPDGGQAVVKRLEVRTWPQRVDVYVVDPERAEVLAHYPLDPEFDSPAFDPFALYADRAEDALERLARDQESLRLHWRLGSDARVALEPDYGMRSVLSETLGHYGLELDQLELRYLRDDYDWLYRLGPEELYRLLVDWVDVAERHYPAGSSLTSDNPDHWTRRSHPERACHFHHLAGLDKAGEDSSEEAYSLFLSLVDVPLEAFSFGHLLRYLYYHLTEFPDRRGEASSPRALAALSSAAVV